MSQRRHHEFPRQEQRQHSIAFSSHLTDDSAVFSTQDTASDLSTPAPTKKQIITEHDHWTDSRNLDTDSGEKDVGQSPGGLVSSSVRIQSNLDDPDDWDDAATQHDPLSHSFEEAEPPVGATHVSHAVCLSRKRRNKETQKRHAKSLKLADRVAEREVMAQPEISHAFVEQILRSRGPRTDGHLVDAIHASHQPALLQEHSKVFFCRQSCAVNAGGSLSLLKSQRD